MAKSRIKNEAKLKAKLPVMLEELSVNEHIHFPEYTTIDEMIITLENLMK